MYILYVSASARLVRIFSFQQELRTALEHSLRFADLSVSASSAPLSFRRKDPQRFVRIERTEYAFNGSLQCSDRIKEKIKLKKGEKSMSTCNTGAFASGHPAKD